MKSIFKLMSAAVLCTAFSFGQARATNVTLDGYGAYEIKSGEKFYPSPPKQSGRYSKLGKDYYHRALIKMDYVVNNSKNTSGSLSFEFWAMPYYDSTSGLVLMTHGLDPLRGKKSIKNVRYQGMAISVGASRFPEIDLWEYTSKGWRHRDHLTFTSKGYL